MHRSFVGLAARARLALPQDDKELVREGQPGAAVATQVLLPAEGGRVVNFLSKLLRGIAFVPAVVQGIEGLFGSRTGAEKKEAALSFVGAALSMTESIASREIVDEGQFREGLGKVIDGTVQCLNASAWRKAK